MPEGAAAPGPLPIVSFLKIPAKGDPYLEGVLCGKCGAVFLGERAACASCGAREGLTAKRLANTGELYVYTIVHRSFPGVAVPYISAIVDLDGGGTVKGNLVGVDPDPGKIRMGMPVEVTYQVAPTKDREGNEYLTYCFRPRTQGPERRAR
jgi:uncharacterized OB-fold protein